MAHEGATSGNVRQTLPYRFSVQRVSIHDDTIVIPQGWRQNLFDMHGEILLLSSPSKGKRSVVPSGRDDASRTRADRPPIHRQEPLHSRRIPASAHSQKENPATATLRRASRPVFFCIPSALRTLRQKRWNSGTAARACGMPMYLVSPSYAGKNARSPQAGHATVSSAGREARVLPQNKISRRRAARSVSWSFRSWEKLSRIAPPDSPSAPFLPNAQARRQAARAEAIT